jgi:hypothetical protein
MFPAKPAVFTSDEWRLYDDGIPERNSVQNDRTTTFSRRSSGNLSITDGPFAETKEHLGGILVLDTED